jgi:hypothetical protein
MRLNAIKHYRGEGTATLKVRMKKREEREKGVTFGDAQAESCS